MIGGLITVNICLILAHLCEGIDWMFYPLSIVSALGILVASSDYEKLKLRVKKLEMEEGAE